MMIMKMTTMMKASSLTVVVSVCLLMAHSAHQALAWVPSSNAAAAASFRVHLRTTTPVAPSFASSTQLAVTTTLKTTRDAPATESKSSKTSKNSKSNKSNNNNNNNDNNSLSPDFEAALTSLQTTLHDLCPEALRGKMLPLLASFADEYMRAANKSFAAGTAAAHPTQASQQFLKGVQYGLQYGIQPETKYIFDVSHTALRGTEPDNTIDYYKFGCDFFRPMMDLEKSVILGRDHLSTAITQQLEAGENVVLFANHQSEADPQVVSCCLEQAGFGDAAEKMIYVAGHKVTTDPLAIPFSMGRNLLCIHSKKHIDADPESKASKQRQNIKAMNALLKSFKSGGALIWVAPSGGRDRRNVETGEIPIAPFDSKTLDIFRLYANKSKVKTHYYTLAMVSYYLCPPPDFVEAGVGEARKVNFEPVGIAMSAELDSHGGLEGRSEFCEQAMASCERDYQQLLEQIAANKQKK
jgi:glycerol-3-phosphate O-acyltransferase